MTNASRIVAFGGSICCNLRGLDAQEVQDRLTEAGSLGRVEVMNVGRILALGGSICCVFYQGLRLWEVHILTKL